MIGDRLVLAAVAIVMIAMSYAAVSQLYFGPAQAMAQQEAVLSTQLDDLETRIVRNRRELAAAGSTETAEGLVVSSGQVADTAAHLQESMRALISQFDGSAMSSQSVVTDLGGGYSKVSVLLRARFGEMALLTFLRAVELQQPVILVDNLSIHLLPVNADGRPLDVTATLTEFHADASPS